MAKQKVLVIAPHPDDVDFTCSGTMALWSKDKEIYYIICTSGEKGNHIGKSKKGIIKIREQEQKEAAKVTGVNNVIFLREPDGELENTKKLREKLVRLIRKIKPDILFSFDPSNTKFDRIGKYHPDHRAMAIAVYDSIYPAIGNIHYFPHHIAKEGLSIHEVKEFYFYGTDYPNTWIDISSVMNKKIKALLCHRSQSINKEDIEKFIKERDAKISKGKRMKYAECFRRLKMPR